MDSEKPASPAPNQRLRPTVHLELDPDTLILSISGTIPHNAVGLAMARQAVDEFEFRCDNERRAADARAIVGPGARLYGGMGRG